MPSQKYLIYLAGKRAFALLLLLGIQPVWADQFDTINYTASGGVNYDDNVFRLPDSIDPQIYLGKTKKSDLTRFVSIGFNIDKKYLSQKWGVSANGTNFKYSNFNELDYTGSSLKGIWYWQVSSKLKGGLNATRTQTLNNPADTRVYSRNLNTNNNLSLNGDGWIVGNLHLLFGLSRNQITNSSSTVNYLSSHSKVIELGVKCEPNEGRYIALLARTIKQTTDGVVQTNTSFNEKQLELKANLQITGKSALSANLMGINHQYDYYEQRNYSGNQGGIDYLLDISDKTSLNISLKRVRNSWWDVASSHYVADSILITPKWQISSKAVMQIVVSQGKNEYRGVSASNAVARKDEVQSYSFGVDWVPQHAVVLSASLQHAKRSSAPALYARYEFNDNIISASAQISL